MKLYVFPPSPRARKVLAVAAHLGLHCEIQIVDLFKGEQKSPEYLKLNPNGRMPTLTDGDTVIWESNAIMQYLASQKPNDLFPSDPKTRLDITRWQFWDAQQWDPACAILLFENLVKGLAGGGPPDAARVAEGEKQFRQWAGVLDGHLAKTGWPVGSGLTLCDFGLAAPLAHADMCRMPLAEFPNVAKWYAKVEALDAWKKTAAPPPR
ncbi:MAG TPA: glutathione S-transferase family protein [Nevskiaceae bacterium]|nr:glutathione S-transferase family protein [Nevskiaceae bacterium]